MEDRRRPYIFSVMAAKLNGTSPDKWLKYDEAFKTEAGEHQKVWGNHILGSAHRGFDSA